MEHSGVFQSKFITHIHPVKRDALKQVERTLIFGISYRFSYGFSYGFLHFHLAMS
jgi:hypothetical protein